MIKFDIRDETTDKINDEIHEVHPVDQVSIAEMRQVTGDVVLHLGPRADPGEWATIMGYIILAIHIGLCMYIYIHIYVWLHMAAYNII